ncbi:unnamed protein product [Cunninghamella echinulata]
MILYSTRYFHFLKSHNITKSSLYKRNPTCFLLSTKRFSSYSKDNIRPDEYELRVGYAITVLQDELPLFFYNGLKSQDIYSQHVVLSDPHYTRLSIKGKTAYLGAAEMLRWSMGCYFDKADLEIIKMRVLPDKPNNDDTQTIHFSPTHIDPPSSSSLHFSSHSKKSLILHTSPSPYMNSINENGLYNTYQQSRQLASIVQPTSNYIINQLRYGNNLPLSSSPSLNSISNNNDQSTTVRSLEIRWILQARPRSFFSDQQQQQQQLREVEGVFIYTFDNQGYISEHKIQRIQPSPSRRILLMHTYGSKLRSFLESLKRRSEPELRPGLGC